MSQIKFYLSDIHDGGLPTKCNYDALPSNYSFSFDARSDNGEDEYECHSPELEAVDTSGLTLAKTEDGQVILRGTASIADPCNDESADFFSGCRETGEIQIAFCIVDGDGNEISPWSDHYTIPCEED